jgi:hypothetical protein
VASAKVNGEDVVHDGFDPDDPSYPSYFNGKDPYDFSYDPDNGFAPGLGIEEWRWGDPWGFYTNSYPWTNSYFSHTFTVPSAKNEWLTVVDDEWDFSSDGPDETSPGSQIFLVEPQLTVTKRGGGAVDEEEEYVTGAFIQVGELRYISFGADPPLEEGHGVIQLQITDGCDKISLWTDDTKTMPYDTTWTFATDEFVSPCVEGIEPSDSVRDIELTLTYSYGSESAVDRVRITVVEVEFSESSPKSGFDATNSPPYVVVDPPWLVVPVNNAPNTNTAKATVTPSDAASYTYFTSDDVNVATVSPPQASQSPQTITVTGVAKGHTCVKAKVGAAVPPGDNPTFALLNICVRNKKTVILDLHYIKDNAEHTTEKDPNDPDSIIEGLNDIWTPQANIVFVKGLVDNPQVNRNMGHAINTWEDYDDVVAFRNGASPDAYFYEKIYYPFDDPNPEEMAGLCDNGNLVIADGTGLVPLCHELGHYFVGPGHCLVLGNIMFNPIDKTDPNATGIMHSQAHEANP